MEDKNFVIKLNLIKFIDSRIVEIDGIDGDRERGLFIPLDKNGLEIYKHNNGVYIKAFANVSTVASQNWNSTHYIVLSPTKKQEKKMKELGYKMPIIGSMGLIKSKKHNSFWSNKDIYSDTNRVKNKDYED